MAFILSRFRVYGLRISLLLPNQGHRLGARARVFAEAAAYGRGDGDRAGLLHAANGHAGVLGLHDDHHADRLESVEERVGNLGGQALLNLQAPRESLDQPRQLRQPDDAPRLRDVCDVALADEGREMVLAERGEADVFDDDHLVVLVARKRPDVLARVFAHPRRQLGVHLRHTPRSPLQAGAPRVFAYAFEDEADAPLDLVEVNFAPRQVLRAFVRLRGRINRRHTQTSPANTEEVSGVRATRSYFPNY